MTGRLDRYPPPNQRSDADPGKKKNDHRSDAQVDRDRVLYSQALRRLAAVTQVVGPSEKHLFHNRLTHTIKVAQTAQRLAQYLIEYYPDEARELELDVDVVEAAALAHDLGHPPFGHAGESELDRVAVESYRHRDGFEGNAQAFRILTRLEAHKIGYEGMGLTRATLNAVLKYPRLRDISDDAREDETKEWRKFGAYRDDKEAFKFARAEFTYEGRSVEAAIMNHADDIAYSLHDFTDFYSAGLIPLDRLLYSRQEELDFKADAEHGKRISPEALAGEAFDLFMDDLRLIHSGKPYTGRPSARAQLRTEVSRLIQKFLQASSLNLDDEKPLSVPDSILHRMQLMQECVWQYVILSPALATQQEGQRQIIRELCTKYLGAICSREKSLIPAPFLRVYEEDLGDGATGTVEEPTSREVRLTLDIVSSLTDAQAVRMHQRLTGIAPGTVMGFVG